MYIIIIINSVDVKQHFNVIDTASKHARKSEAFPPRINNEYPLSSNDLVFICAGVSNVIKETPDIIQLSDTNLLLFEHPRKSAR